MSYYQAPDRLYTKTFMCDTEPPTQEEIRIGETRSYMSIEQPGHFELTKLPPNPRHRPPGAAIPGLLEVKLYGRNVKESGAAFTFDLQVPRQRRGRGSMTVSGGFVSKLVLHVNGEHTYRYDLFNKGPAVTPPPANVVTLAPPNPTCGPNGEIPSASPESVVTFCEPAPRKP